MATEEKVFSPIVLMIDNETLSLRPDAYITQVGYVVGNVLTGQVLEGPRNVGLMSGGSTKAHIDIDTVRWWMTEPSDAARKAVFNPDISTTSYRYSMGPWGLFDIFEGVVRQFGEGLTVWAKPAMFDLPQLTTAWRGRKPWHFRAERDLSTMAALLDPYRRMGPPKESDEALKHTGAADALWQFQYLVNLVGVLLQNDMHSWAKVLDGAEAA